VKVATFVKEVFNFGSENLEATVAKVSFTKGEKRLLVNEFSVGVEIIRNVEEPS